MRTNDLPFHPRLTHPLTGERLRAVHVTKRGLPVWPVMGGSQPAGGEPAPVSAPPASTAPAQPAPTPAAPAQQPAAQPPAQQQPATGTPPAEGSRPNAIGANGEDLGYPVNTPVAEMSAKQEAAYWRHKARTHEDRNKAMSDYDDLKRVKEQYDSLVQASQTEHEKAVSEAETRGKTAGLLVAGEQVVEALFRAHALNRVAEDSVNALLENLDRKRFINSQTGAVDTDRVRQLVDNIAPAPAAAPAPGVPNPGQQTPPAPGVPAPGVPAPGVPTPSNATPAGGPDMGQGRPTTAGPTGIAAGQAIARARFAKQHPAQSASAGAQ